MPEAPTEQSMTSGGRSPTQRLRQRVALGVALGVGLIVGAANLTKAVHIDDTLYLSIARRILTHPLDPYGGTLNWQQIPEPTYNVSISPPLLSYYFALVISICGENVVALHASMIPWCLLACWALFWLGDRWAGTGLAVVVLVMGGPAVVVGMNLMLDVPLLACVCASAEWLARGLDERRGTRMFVLSGFFGAVGVLIKLPGLMVVPLAVVAAVQTRRWRPLIAGALPLVALGGWQAASRSIYGVTQVNAGISFLGHLWYSLPLQTAERAISMAAILGLTFPLWIAALFRRRRRAWPVTAAFVVAVLAAVLQRAASVNPARSASPLFPVAVFLGTIGLIAALMPTRPTVRDEDRAPVDPRPLLYVWVAAGAALVILFGPFVAVRSFLPIEAPLLILLLGKI
jgi:hypothetical protein